MGAGKSKPKEPGQRSMSLDGTIGSGSDSGALPPLGPAQQTQTPTGAPAVGTGQAGAASRAASRAAPPRPDKHS
ncbi:hypothetical protein KUCAC02_030046 [Chaenocephalus aceratus]|uniref:Uncharacterized protein n=1 Tax=Chaenocephalus aceratus TaxID=36190 RepID=A0ACB9XJS3_CHAAC|nr:hypothetical protein KUCAC02_030046 [Chaenocephalus aceratus]